MKALTLHQPWAQLMVTRQECNVRQHPEATGPRCPCHEPEWCATDPAVGCDLCAAWHVPLRMVKTIETRSWPAPKALIGQRIAIHAAARPSIEYDPSTRGGWMNMHVAEGRDVIRHIDGTEHPAPLGVIVGSAVLAACVPIVLDPEDVHGDLAICNVHGDVHTLIGAEQREHPGQGPFGDFAPGRWAWILTDAAPTTERCPACWGSAHHPSTTTGELIHAVFTVSPFANRLPLRDCPVCDGAGRCAPIPAKGRQRVWEWAP